MTTAVWWIRRDLRLHDNQALDRAIREADAVLPVFIVDPVLAQSPYVGDKRRAFLWDGLRALDAALRQRGGRLIVRHGAPAEMLPQLVQETNATAVYAEEDYSPYAKRRDTAVAAVTPLYLTGGLAVRHAQDVLKDDGHPYVVYTPYKNRWKERPLPRLNHLLPPPEQLNTPPDIASDPIPAAPTLPDGVPFVAGEAEARRRLDAFVAGKNAPIFTYQARRDFPAQDGTSQLSPYLRFGMVSARTAVVAALGAIARASDANGRHGGQTWLDELVWRDFYLSILCHFPHVRHGSFRDKYDAIRWDNDEKLFAAWCNGRTGYPIVDAAMRQLTHSGWMHNRARMIVASFLVKDLLINWQWGEQFFMQHLVDGDPAANNGGWQWSAGTGTDAAPYFRIFNPTSQGKKFDPDGAYIRRWLPELASVDAKYIHEPAKMPPMEQRRVDCIIGHDYPSPIVDHKAARQRTLDAYKAI